MFFGYTPAVSRHLKNLPKIICCDFSSKNQSTVSGSSKDFIATISWSLVHGGWLGASGKSCSIFQTDIGFPWNPPSLSFSIPTADGAKPGKVAWFVCSAKPNAKAEMATILSFIIPFYFHPIFLLVTVRKPLFDLMRSRIPRHIVGDTKASRNIGQARVKLMFPLIIRFDWLNPMKKLTHCQGPFES